ncbi:MAG: LuxR C-terminal-related transcriptional regulator, partial [Duncaniella sp.]|nr:LuxR C-terminal-related transcriptional regulator [Duncaniella sp.]
DAAGSPARTDDLSPREKDVILGIVKGFSNKEIAAEMNVSVNTVMTHRRNIASKLQIHSVAGLTIYAITTGLVDIADISNSDYI